MDCKTIGDYTLERRAVILSAEKPFNIGSVLHVLLTDIAFFVSKRNCVSKRN